MKVRVFRGAIRPPLFLGMPFLFGVLWMFVSFLVLLWMVVLLRDTGIGLVIGFMTVIFVSLSIFFLVREVTKKDPYRLHQLFLLLKIKLEQNNFGKRGEYVYAPYEPKRKK
ncbi:MAG TPA: VirB3 family type IV secretion system protein [Methylobacter sp.]|jgi:hypothetical protein